MAADEQEGGAGEILRRGPGDFRAEALDGGCPVSGDLDHLHQCGMGGPLLWPGSIMNVYTGGTATGPRRLVARADPRVARVRVQFASGEHLELPPVATLPDPGLAFFAALLPRTAAFVSVAAVGEDGRTLESQDLARHEQAWQRAQRRAGGSST